MHKHFTYRRWHQDKSMKTIQFTWHHTILYL